MTTARAGADTPSSPIAPGAGIGNADVGRARSRLRGARH